ncbi:MAG: Zn-ribbon domain-containing OB-fold protein [Actinomycetota bacterium]
MKGEPFETRRLTQAELAEQVITVSHRVQAQYAWDAGAAIGGYLKALREGRLVGRACLKCRRTLIPPRMFCEQCFRPTDEWVDLADSGTVATFSICHVSWDMRPLSTPEIPAVIDIDGASPGMGILHKLGEVEPEDVAAGMRVRAVWRPPDEREGSILDIRYFAPAGS